MPISDAQFLTWMRDGRNKRAVLFMANYHDGTSEKTRYFGTRSFVSLPTDTPANTPFPARVRGAPEFNADSSDSMNWGSVDIRNDGSLDGWLFYGWGDRELKMGLGDPAWPLDDFRFVSLRTSRQGITAPDRNTLRLYFFDALGELDRPIQTTLLASGDPVPLCYGTVFNAAPAYLGEDVSGAHYQVHSGAVDSITVRSGGLSAAGVTLDLANGKFTINPAPTGRVTCDVVNSTYSTAAEIVEEIITGQLGLTGRIDAANFAAFPSFAPLGVYITDRRNARAVITEIMRSVGGVCSPDIGGTFFLWRNIKPLSTDTADIEVDYRGQIARNGLSLAEIFPPVQKIRLGYQMNHSPQDEDALFGAVSTADRELYSREYSVATGSQSLIKYNEALEYPADADGNGITGTLIAGESDAIAEAARRLGELEEPLKIFEVIAFIDPVQIKLGDIMKITHPRFSWLPGRLGRIIGYRWNPSRRRCIFRVVKAYYDVEGVFSEDFSEDFA